MADVEVKRGRGRPKGSTKSNKLKEARKRALEKNAQNGEVPSKKGRGRPRLAESDKKLKVQSGKKGRPTKDNRKKFEENSTEEEERDNKSEEGSENDDESM